MSDHPIRRAILSVSDKTGIVTLARQLKERGVDLLSTGGTRKALEEAGLEVVAVEDYTGFPEILEGRVKTLHPKIFAGILARRARPDDLQTLQQQNIPEIDLVIVNLYPFESTIANPTASWEEIIEQIDIGGPSLLPAQPPKITRMSRWFVILMTIKRSLKIWSVIKEAFRRLFGASSPVKFLPIPLAMTPSSPAIFLRMKRLRWDRDGAREDASDASDTQEAPSMFPPVYAVVLPKSRDLRYGENPHQAAAFYADPATEEPSMATARQIHGKELSYNNLLDAEGALEMARDFTDLAPAATVVVKHSNPCGIALGDTLEEAYLGARECDPDSAFGGIVALTQPVDSPTAERLAETFLEVIIAPDFESAALDILARKKNLRLLVTGPLTPKQPKRLARSIVGGLLVMDRDLGLANPKQLRVMTQKHPTDEDLEGLLFAWRCVKWVKSNAIVYTTKRVTLGIGAGQMSRADATRLGAT